MRIRKRWPPLPPPRTTLPLYLRSSSLLPSSQSHPLHQTQRPSPLLANQNFSKSASDSPNHSLPFPTQDENHRRLDLQLVPDQKIPHCLPSSFHQGPQIVAGEENNAAEEKGSTESSRKIGYEHNAEASAGSSSLSHQGHWCEEDKVFPLKKRRVSFKSKRTDTMIRERERKKKKINVREGRKTNKCIAKDEDDNDNVVDKDGAMKRESSSGGKIFEGSSCSRVNGRGWRCSQPTLVGYSLCEHHLGKGRLRSMNTTTSVPRRTASNVKAATTTTETGTALDKSLYEDKNKNDNGGEKGLIVGKKRKKIGALKARSISSLLSQTVPSPPPPPLIHHQLSTDISGNTQSRGVVV